MKRTPLLLLLLVCGIASTGCARRYVIRLNNGMQMTTASKPRLQDGSYRFKDASGQEQFVSEGRVREILPASQAREKESFFRSGAGK